MTNDDRAASVPAIPSQRTYEPPARAGQRQTSRKPARGKLLTLEEVYVELGVARSTFYDWRAKGKAPQCITLPNGQLRIREVEFDRWLAGREDAA
jgi:predicted DNA-binding transcriptional regulator AlpA